jgi:hypothetical protein
VVKDRSGILGKSNVVTILIFEEVFKVEVKVEVEVEFKVVVEEPKVK